MTLPMHLGLLVSSLKTVVCRFDRQICELQAITRVIEAQDQMVENAKMGTVPTPQQRA